MSALGRRAAGVALLATMVAGCNVLLGNDPWTLASHDSGASSGDGATQGDDEGGTTEGGSPESGADSSSGGADATGVDATPEAAPEAGVDSGLSPLLSVPAFGPTCNPANDDVGCPPGTSCRIATTTSGLCDGTTAGHEGGWPCTQDTDCDDTLQCYNGECKVLCPLGQTCAGGCECLDVGNVDTGICCPGS